MIDTLSHMYTGTTVSAERTHVHKKSQYQDMITTKIEEIQLNLPRKSELMCEILLPPVYHIFGFQILFQFVRDFFQISVCVAAHFSQEWTTKFAAQILVLGFLPFLWYLADISKTQTPN